MLQEYPSRPYPRAVDQSWMSQQDWRRRVVKLRQAPQRARARLAFLGDSITEGWLGVAPSVWKESFAHYQPLCLGIGGDQTQHLLWRIEDGELDQLPELEVLVLLIGVNNLGWGAWSPEATLEGLEAVQQSIRARLPGVHVIQHKIFPAGATPNDPLRLAINTVNQGLSRLARDGWDLLDLSQQFLDADGSLPVELMADFLHPTVAGYRRWASALQAPLAALLG